VFNFEWLTIAYAAAFLAASAVAPVRLRPRAAAASAALVTAVVLAAWTFPSRARVVLPHLYLIAGYWLPALLVDASHASHGPSAFESWLARRDAGLRSWLPAVPPGLLPLAELAYLACYPLLPITFGLVFRAASFAELDRFWTCVLGAGFASYASLPWLLSRPPRMSGAQAHVQGVRALNIDILRRGSHQWNTFPSGHAAVSVAAAVSLWAVSPAAGVAAFVVAVGVAVGAAAGGYHYAIDVALGFLLGLAAAMLTW
jgi:membrane-associated phospholipid phosphatase